MKRVYLNYIWPIANAVYKLKMNSNAWGRNKIHQRKWIPILLSLQGAVGLELIFSPSFLLHQFSFFLFLKTLWNMKITFLWSVLSLAQWMPSFFAYPLSVAELKSISFHQNENIWITFIFLSPSLLCSRFAKVSTSSWTSITWNTLIAPWLLLGKRRVFKNIISTQNNQNKLFDKV